MKYILFVIVALFLMAATVHAETLSGRLSSDMTVSGEVTVKGDVVVEKGVTLTVSEGTVITIYDGTIDVHGAIFMRGSEAKPITVAGLGEERSNGIRILNSKEKQSLIKYCTFNNLNTAVTVINSKALIENSSFANNNIAIDAKQKDEAVIRGNHIKNGLKVGIFAKSGSNAMIQNNKISGINKFGIYIYRSAGVTVTGNDITNCDSGIMIGFVGSDPAISGNSISSNKIGVIVEKGANPDINSNSIAENGIGIKLSKRSDPKITMNSITKNERGIFITFSSYPTIERNDFVDNKHALYLEMQSAEWEKAYGASIKRGGERKRVGAFGASAGSEIVTPRKNPSDKVYAKNNYWGDDVTKEMAKSGGSGNISVIYDYFDLKDFLYEGKKYKLDYVDYSDWAEEPVAGTNIKAR